MKPKRTIKSFLCGVAVVLLLAGCSKDNPDTTNREDGKVRISFSAPIVAEDAPSQAPQATTRAVLPTGTTVRVVAYTSTNPTYKADQAYYMAADNKLKPCTVDTNGEFIAEDTQSELALYPDTYDFYAYTPALPLVNKNSVTVANGVDYASSVTSDITVSTDKTQSLNQLNRKCTRIKLVVKTDAANTLMKALSVAANGVTINNLPATTAVGINQSIPQASGSATLTVPQSAFTAEGASKTESSAITYLLPRLGTDRLKIDYNLTYTVSGSTETKLVSGSMGNTVLEEGKSYTFTLTMRQAGASLSVAEWIENNQDVAMGQKFDYTEDGNGWFLVASGDVRNPDPTANDSIKMRMNWYVANGIYDAAYNPNKLKACPDGWRVPTLQEANLIYIYKNAIPVTYKTTGYWQSLSYDNTNTWRVSYQTGISYFTNSLKSANLNVRCIRGVASKKYPYVAKNEDAQNRIIVSRDNDGGVRKEAIRANWTTGAPIHTTSSPENCVPARLEVAKNDCNATTAPGIDHVNNQYTWENAVKACAAYHEKGDKTDIWHLPTQKELMLIHTSSKQSILDIATPADGWYWSSTNITINNTAWYINLIRGNTDNYFATLNCYVRCVRDVQ